MFIVQILLPLFGNEGHVFPDSLMSEIRSQLVEKFGGITAFNRSPAEGVWSDHGKKIRDDVVLLEVMVVSLDRPWWARFRTHLEGLLQQQSLVIRATPIEKL